MATLKLKSKKPAGDGNVEYTYECFCVPKPVLEIKGVYGNENEAKADAQNQCDAYCQNQDPELKTPIK